MSSERTSEIFTAMESSDYDVFDEKFFEASRKLLLDPNFPTPNCLSPADIAAFVQEHRLGESEQSHIRECVHCCALTRMLVPESSRVEEFRREVLLRKAAANTSAERNESRTDDRTSRFAGWTTRAISMAVACAIVATFVPAVSRKFPNRNGEQNQNSTALGYATAPMGGFSGAVVGDRVPVLRRATVEFTVGGRTLQAKGIAVQDENRIAPESQEIVAAYAAMWEGAGARNTPKTKMQTALQSKVAIGLQSLTQSVGNEWVQDPPSAEQQCTDFAHALRDKSIKVSVVQSSGFCIAKTRRAQFTINPQIAVNDTNRFFHVLDDTKGNVAELNKETTHVDLKILMAKAPVGVRALR